MYKTPIPSPSRYVVGENSAMGSSAYMRPLEPQLPQMNTSFSAVMELQWQPKEAAFLVGNNKDKGTSNGIHEECKAFGRMFREKLQEFAMILIKKYHYNFPVEYFEDYHGSFNKEEFLGVEWKKDTGFDGIEKDGGCKDSACSNNRKSEGLAPSVWIKEELKEYSNPFGQKNVDEDDPDDNSRSPKQEMLEAFDQLSGMAGDTKESLESGSDSAAMIEELEGEIIPQEVPTGRLEEEGGEDKYGVYNNDQGTALEKEFPAVAIVQVPIDDLQYQGWFWLARKMESLPMTGNGMIKHVSPVEASSNVVKMGGLGKKFQGQLIIGGKLREITEEVKSLVVRDGTPAALVVVAPAAPSSEAHKQASSKHLRQVSNFPLLHFQDIAGNFTIKHGGGQDGNAINAARDTCITYLLVRDGDGLSKEAMGTLNSSFRLQVPTTNHVRPGVADHAFQ